MNSDYKHLIKLITLSQNSVFYENRKANALTKMDIEVLCYASMHDIFSTYQIRKFFVHTNPQQIIRSIKKLVLADALEVMRSGTKGKPAIYMLTDKGNLYVNDYFLAIQKRLVC